MIINIEVKQRNSHFHFQQSVLPFGFSGLSLQAREREKEAKMKIYDSSSGDDEGITSTRSRNKVSFLHSPVSDNSKTPGGGGSVRRTPFRPHNHQQSDSSPMHAFRKSLHGDTLQKSSTKDSTRTVHVNDKENQPNPGSAQAFRRNLRATLTSQPTTATTSTSTTIRPAIGGRRFRTSLGPPQRVQVPFSSPGSLLRTELTDEDLEESLLVSPPGALWNVLNTSSTGLVIVSPQAAEHISQTWSEQKQKLDTEDMMFSPPKPRMLLSGQTPVATNLARRNQDSSVDQRSSSDQTRIEGPQKDPSSLEQSLGQIEVERKDKGVSMDMTMMFSDSQKDTLSTKSGPPAHLVNRLSAKKTTNVESKDSITKSMKGEKQKGLSFATSRASQSLKQPKRQVSTKPVLPKPSVSRNDFLPVSSVTETPTSDNVLQSEDAEPKNKETPGGVSMDLSGLFGKESSARGARAAPPPHMVARLSRTNKPATFQRVRISKDSSCGSTKSKPTMLPSNKRKTQSCESDASSSNPVEKISSREERSRDEVKVNAADVLTNTFSEQKQKAASRSHLAAPSSKGTTAKQSTVATSEKPNNLTRNKAVNARKPIVSTRSNQTMNKKATELSSMRIADATNKKKVGACSSSDSISSVLANDKSSSKSKTGSPPHLLSRLSQPTTTSSQKTKSLFVRLETSSTSQKRVSSALLSEFDGKRASRRVLSPTDAIRKNQQLSIGKPNRVSLGEIKATQNSKGKYEMQRKPNKENTRIVSQKNSKQAMAKILSRPAHPTTSRRVEGATSLEEKPNSFRSLKTEPVPRKQTQTTPKASNLAPSHRSPQNLNASKLGGDWADKQCSAFVSWLDFILNPVDEDVDESIIATDTRINMRALLMHRRLAKVRFEASELFQGEEMKRIKTVIHGEIFKGRLSIRTDRDLHSDLSLREELISLLLSYTTPWLRLGLEVFFGECIELEQPTSDDIPEHMVSLLITFIRTEVWQYGPP